jgi:AcrR family transcriptional regulator
VAGRRGLTRAAVIETAARMADDRGLEALTLGGVASALDVRTPSLYNHVDGLAGLRRELALVGVQELGERLRDGAVGRAGADALAAVATAYRGYARERPGCYQALQQAPDPEDGEMVDAARRTLQPLLAVLAGYGLEGEDAIHAARGLRSALHGFVELERVGGFGMDVDVDASFRFMLGALDAGLRAREPVEGSSRMRG